MLSIELGPETEQRLKALADRNGKTESEFVRQLLEDDLEDLEDLRIAEERLSNPGARLSSAQVRRELGLED